MSSVAGLKIKVLKHICHVAFRQRFIVFPISTAVLNTLAPKSSYDYYNCCNIRLWEFKPRLTGVAREGGWKRGKEDASVGYRD